MDTRGIAGSVGARRPSLTPAGRVRESHESETRRSRCGPYGFHRGIGMRKAPRALQKLRGRSFMSRSFGRFLGAVAGAVVTALLLVAPATAAAPANDTFAGAVTISELPFSETL